MKRGAIMTKLDKLLAELCPNGVELKKVKDVYKRLKGTPITATKMKEIDNPNGEIRIFAGGKTVINAREEDISKANITRVPAVLVQSRGVIDVVYYNKPFTFKNEMWAYTAENEIEVKYLFYVLKKDIMKFREAASGMGSLPQISLPVTEEFVMPVPPLEVQREIVHILDKFTGLTTELTTELTARKMQYEYYRNFLISKEVNAEKITLRDIARNYCSGGTPLKSHREYYKNGDIPWLRTQEVTFNEITNTQCFITEEGLINSSAKWIPTNCVIVAISGASAGRCAINKIPLTTNQHCLNIEIDISKALYKYVYYCICNQYKDLIAKKEGARGDLNAKRILDLKISIPSLEVQRKIVSVLDNFEAICTNLNSGLPAEIEVRRKQYEYYRDKLLSFKKLSE